MSACKKTTQYSQKEERNETNINNVICKSNSSSPIYAIGDKIIYSYRYIMPEDHDPGYILKDIRNCYIEKIIITVRANESDKKKYFSYNYPPQKTTTSSLIIETDKKVWIHPPRNFFFKILELNPFPYITKPIQIGAKWSWSLDIGQQYSDKRWAEWEKEITNVSSYEIIKDTVLSTKLGKLYCYVINSDAESEIGKTYLTAFFNKQHGFVKLNYKNIDGSLISLDITEHKREPKSFFRVGEIKF